MIFEFKYQARKYKMDIEKCDTPLKRARGLMFRKKSKPLLFIFPKKNLQGIHSFFCMPFIAIWFSENEIIDVKFVKPWTILVKPCKKFDKLLEIPRGDITFEKFYRRYRNL